MPFAVVCCGIDVVGGAQTVQDSEPALPDAASDGRASGDAAGDATADVISTNNTVEGGTRDAGMCVPKGGSCSSSTECCGTLKCEEVDDDDGDRKCK
jgi:hypothetical protein